MVGTLADVLDLLVSTTDDYTSCSFAISTKLIVNDIDDNNLKRCFIEYVEDQAL